MKNWQETLAPRLRQSAIGFLIVLVVPTVAGAERIGVEIPEDPPNLDWTQKILFTPVHTSIRNIPVREIDPHWRRASELDETAIPASVVPPHSPDSVSAHGLSFSLTGDLKGDGGVETALVGVYQDDTGKIGKFLLVLEKISASKWEKLLLVKNEDRKGLLLLGRPRDGSRGFWVGDCTECDSGWVKYSWHRQSQRFRVGDCADDLKPPGGKPVIQQADAVIPPAGGQITLKGYGTVTFPAGSFSAAQPVRLTATTDPDISTIPFDAGPGMPFKAGPRAAYELHLNTGSQAPGNFTNPATDVCIALNVPASLLEKLPAGYEPQLYVLVPERDVFESWFATYANDTRYLTTNDGIGPDNFDNTCMEDDSFELVMLIASQKLQQNAKEETDRRFNFCKH